MLPPELVPFEKRHIVQPRARLYKALHGHPESSAHWSLHLADILKLKMSGTEFQNMPSVWWFDGDRMLMSVYELCGKAPKATGSPHLEDEFLSAEEDAVKSRLSSVAARLVMKFMWLSRTSRPDITCAVNLLAEHITCWSSNDERRVARLVGYLSSTINLAHPMVVLDPLSGLHIALYCDADFAGDSSDAKHALFLLNMKGRRCLAI